MMQMNNTDSHIEKTLEMMQQQIVSEKTDSEFYWYLEQLQHATDGDFIGPLFDQQKIRFTSVSTDTRTLQAGALYIAIKGANFDGHAFIDEAIKQGAVAVLVSEDVETIVPGVQVDDTRIALGQFARWHRQQMPLKKLIAVTGSNGKTTVKTLLADIFALNGNVLATEGNLNNDFGVPRTLLNIRPEHDYAVIEMGANHLHEIGYLAALALPDIALLNNASGAHLEGFGSLEGVIETKGEIFDGLNANGANDGVAISNTDSAGFDYWQNKIRNSGIKHNLTFGSNERADIRLIDCQTQSDTQLGLELILQFEELGQRQNHQVVMPILGEHNAMNAAACCAVALAAGLNWAQIKPALETFSGVGGRLQQNQIASGWLLDDSYNANPESVKAGIKALTSLQGESVLCLGAMAEIGEQSDSAHIEVAQFAHQQGVSTLYVLGEKAKVMPEAFQGEAMFFDNHQAMAEVLAMKVRQAAEQNKKLNVLVKGSRSACMEKVSQALLQN